MESKFQFSKQELKDFSRFFEGEVGQKYLAKLKDARDNWLLAATQQPSQELTFKTVNIAQGIANVVADIEAGIEEAKKDDKEGADKSK